MPDYPNPIYQTDNENQAQAKVHNKKNEVDIDIDDLTPDELSETIRQEKSGNSFISSFTPKPNGVHFDSQMKKEEIVLLLRRHPVTHLSKTLIIIFLFFFPLVMLASPMLSFEPLNFKIATIIAWYLVLMGFTIETFLTWYFRVFIITNRRVIDIDYYSMVNKDITTAELSRIQDMSVVSTGVLASIIDFGTLYLQTAGQNFNPARLDNKTDTSRSAGIEFEDISHPVKVKKIVNELIITKRKKNGGHY